MMITWSTVEVDAEQVCELMNSERNSEPEGGEIEMSSNIPVETVLSILFILINSLKLKDQTEELAYDRFGSQEVRNEGVQIPSRS